MSTPHENCGGSEKRIAIGRSPEWWKRNGKRRRKLDVGEKKGLHQREVAVAVIVVSGEGTDKFMSCKSQKMNPWWVG